MTFDMSHLPQTAVSASVRAPDGQPATKIEVLGVEPGQQLRLSFESVGQRWRQGVFLATSGRLEVADTSAPSLTIWSDTAPKQSVVHIARTDGRLVLYNIWDSGRGRRPFESQSATSGMFVEELADGSRRYSCSDIGLEPDFGRLVFNVSIE